ncbi:hypothetical protein H3N56_04380 [Cetobacterium sp. 2A]|uniref:hypothetical protein n=1 Tax=Cetobacterium sp. 2A TaxID=2754723 RepID=UPI00163BA061|nr:hypothetical protein [Cetobacterium sp. 2A]MBC2855735.1 hypothetical protein [Cetobacterium sp. 2A]
MLKIQKFKKRSKYIYSFFLNIILEFFNFMTSILFNISKRIVTTLICSSILFFFIEN